MSQQYVFKHLPTPRGRLFVQVFLGFELIAVSRKSYETAEDGYTDLRRALDQNRFEQVVRYADGASHEQAQ